MLAGLIQCFSTHSIVQTDVVAINHFFNNV